MIQLVLCLVCCGNFDFAFEAKIAALTPPSPVKSEPVSRTPSPVSRTPSHVIQNTAPVIQNTVIRQAGPTWTWPGDLANHLRSEHGQNVSGMSFESMRALHDNLHNRASYTMPSYTMPSYTMPSYTMPSYTMPSYCPSGT